MNMNKMLAHLERDLKQLQLRKLLACSEEKRAELANQIKQHEHVIEVLKAMSIGDMEVR